MGNLFGGTQNATAKAAADATSNTSMLALQQQVTQNQMMMQEQQDATNLVNSRTAALQAETGPNVAAPYALQGLPTIATSELGDQSTPSTSRNTLLGN